MEAKNKDLEYEKKNESTDLDAKVENGIDSLKEEKTMILDDQEKVVSEIKFTYSMLYIGGKLTFGALVKANIKDKLNEDDKSGFFKATASVDEEVTQLETFIYMDDIEKSVTFLDVSNKKLSSFLVDGKENPTFDMYDEVIAKAIKKDIGKFKRYFKSVSSNSVKSIVDLKESELKALIQSPKLEEAKEYIEKQYALMMKGIEEEKKKNGSLGLEEFIDRYAFKKHVLLIGKAGTKFELGSFAA